MLGLVAFLGDAVDGLQLGVLLEGALVEVQHLVTAHPDKVAIMMQIRLLTARALRGPSIGARSS